MSSTADARKDKFFKVLLIEDNVAYANVLIKRLSHSSSISFQVRHASRLQEGLDLLKKSGIDVVLLDLALPDSQGLETLTKVEAQAPCVPVVVLTGLDDHIIGMDAVRKGAQDYWVKGRVDGETLSQALYYAIERNQIQMSLRNPSLTDELTGLHNRRGFLILVEQQLKMSRRAKKGLLLVFIDLDGLKGINDTFGHQAGDQALIDTARILMTTFRDSDVIARIGGDEFAILAIEARPDHAAIVLTRLDRKLKFHNDQEDRMFKLSLSSGFAYFNPANPCSSQELMTQADKAMYHCKSARGTLAVQGSIESASSKPPAKETVWEKTSPSENGKKKILIIEDDQSIQKFLGYRLRKLGFDVIVARDGKEGLEEAVGQVPDLIILDLMLPEFSGEGVCKAIREDDDEGFANIPIIMLTAKTGDVDRIIGKVIGANSYMTKPFSAKELLAEVNRLVGIS